MAMHLATASALAVAAQAAGARWPQFRGPDGSGVSCDSSFPTEFGPGTSQWWKVALPPGNSSPCIWDEALFITAYAEPDHRVLCLDARTGELRWERSMVGAPRERGSGLSNPASPTSCTDGERVISYFGPLGVVCHDFDGRELWRRLLPEPATQHGVGTSPVLADDRVILLRDQDVGSHLLALDKRSGETVWRAERPDFRRGFCTPLVTGSPLFLADLLTGHEPPDSLYRPTGEGRGEGSRSMGSGRDVLVIAPGTLRIVAYDARDGQERWRVVGLPNEICASPVAGDGLIFCAGWTPGSGVARMPGFGGLLAAGDRNGDGQLARDEVPSGPAAQHFNYMDADRDGMLSRAEYEFIAGVFQQSQNALLAVRPGGSGDVTGSHVAWRHARGLPYVPTPLLYRGRLYLLKNGGLLTCLEAKSGEVLFQEERLGVVGDNYASPVAADGKIAIVSQSGTVAVVGVADGLEVLARNPLGEPVLATPAIAHDALYVRSRQHLWAFKPTIR